MVYLDNAATTFPKPEEVYKMVENSARHAFNTGRGSYKVARESSKIIDDVKSELLNLNNIKNGKVIFQTSATESLNNIIFGTQISDGDNIYISPFEHNSIIRPLHELQKRKKINIHVLPFDKENWDIDVEKMNNMFVLNNPKMILLSHVSNVNGYILPYNEIFKSGKVYNSINVLDSSQGYGVVKIEDASNIDYIVFAGHKSLYGIFGIAGFIKLTNDELKPYIFGGTGADTMNPEMGKILEAGSPNIIAISSLLASIDWIKKNDIYSHEKKLTDYLINELKKLENIEIYLPQNDSNIIGIVSINVKNYKADDVGSILDEEFNICVRTGFHCAPLIHDFLDTTSYGGTVRISLGFFTTIDEIDVLINSLKEI